MKTLFICALLLGTAAVTTSADNATRDTLDALGALLSGSQESYHQAFSNAGYHCPLNPCDGSITGYNLRRNFSLVVNGDESSLATAFGKSNSVETRQYHSPLTGPVHEELCGVVNMGSSWKGNQLLAPASRASGRNHTVLYQYYAGVSEEFGVYPMVPCNLTLANYTPSTRPYFGAASEARDMVLLLDVSGLSTEATADRSQRLALIKSGALSILGTLTHADFIGVVIYQVTADTMTVSGGTMNRATESHLNVIKGKIAAIEVPAPASADMGAAFAAAADLLQDATSSGGTANCVQTVVLLTSGANELQSLGGDPGRALAELPDTVVSVNLVAKTPSDAFLARCKALACNYNGILRRSWSSSQNKAFARAMTDYFSALAVNPTVRWSEPYLDAFGQGRIVSGVRPIYSHGSDSPDTFAGVLVMDVSVDSLVIDPADPHAEALLTEDLLQGRSCHGVGRGDQGAVLAALQLDNNCPAKVDGVELESTRALGGWVVLSIFMVPLSLIPLLVIYLVKEPRRYCSHFTSACVIILSIGVCICLVYWVVVYPGQIRRDDWDPVSLRVGRHEERGYHCCRKDCSCAEAPSGAQKCSETEKLQKSGACGGGYWCCEWKCRECNCRQVKDSNGNSREECDCCEYCAKSVRNISCRIGCGTCYSPTITTSYVYKGETLYTQFGTSCGMNGTQCRDEYFAHHPISNETSIAALVNPENPYEVRLNDGYNTAAFVAVVVLGGLMGVVWLGTLVGLIAAGAMRPNAVPLAKSSPGQELAKMEGHSDAVNSVAWSPDGTRLASASSDNTLRVWNADTGHELAKLEGHSDMVRSVAWSADGTRLASASSDNTLRVWNADTGQELAKMEGHRGEARSVAWSPDGTRLASASYDETLRVWNPDSGQELAKMEGGAHWVYSVAWSPDGTRLASASEDKTLRVWNSDTGQELAKIEGHSGWVYSVAWSPDGTRLASASEDKTLRVWNSDTGQELAKMEGHSGWVRSVAWSPDGTRLASASHDNGAVNDKTLCVWNSDTGQELAKLEGHSGAVYSVAWSPDGTRLASASYDETLRIWASVPLPKFLADPQGQIERAQRIMLAGAAVDRINGVYEPQSSSGWLRCGKPWWQKPGTNIGVWFNDGQWCVGNDDGRCKYMYTIESKADMPPASGWGLTPQPHRRNEDAKLPGPTITAVRLRAAIPLAGAVLLPASTTDLEMSTEFPAWMKALPIEDNTRAILMGEGVTEASFVLLNESDLKEMGLATAPRELLVKEIAIRQPPTAAAPVPKKSAFASAVMGNNEQDEAPEELNPDSQDEAPKELDPDSRPDETPEERRERKKRKKEKKEKREKRRAEKERAEGVDPVEP